MAEDDNVFNPIVVNNTVSQPGAPDADATVSVLEFCVVLLLEYRDL